MDKYDQKQDKNYEEEAFSSNDPYTPKNNKRNNKNSKFGKQKEW